MFICKWSLYNGNAQLHSRSTAFATFHVVKRYRLGLFMAIIYIGNAQSSP